MSDWNEILSTDSGVTPPADSGVEETSQVSDLSGEETAEVSGDSDVGDKAKETSSQKEESTETDSEVVVDENQQPKDEEIKDETDFDAALAKDKPTGKKYADSLINHLKGKLGERETELQTFQTIGTPEDAQKYKQFYDDFHGFEEKDGQFVPKAANIAASVIKDSPEIAISLTNSLMAQPDPQNPTKTILQSIIETPEVEEYFAQKFQVNNDPILEEVPEEFHQAYNALSPEEKENFEYAKDEARMAMLKRAQRDIDLQKQQEQFQQEQNQKRQQEFQTKVETTVNESFNSVVNSFDESLKQIPFASETSLNSFQAYTVRNAILTAATESERPSGKQAIEALTAIGIKMPNDVPNLVKQIETLSAQKAKADFEKNNPASTFFATSISTAQKQLIARGNEIAAQIAAKFGTNAKNISKQKENLISQIKSRPEVNGHSGNEKSTVNARTSYSDILAGG